jgi:hypothetical protein
MVIAPANYPSEAELDQVANFQDTPSNLHRHHIALSLRSATVRQGRRLDCSVKACHPFLNACREVVTRASVFQAPLALEIRGSLHVKAFLRRNQNEHRPVASVDRP